MRRPGGMAWRGQADSCKHGHAFTPENTYRRTDGTRLCRACNARIALERYRRLTAEGSYVRATREWEKGLRA
jgi:hypothetical protein